MPMIRSIKSPELQRTYGASNVVSVFVVGFGLWTVLCHLSVLTGRTFSNLQTYAWTVLPVSALLYAVRPKLMSWSLPSRQRNPTVRGNPLPITVALAISIGIMILFLLSDNFLVYWWCSAIFLASLCIWPAPVQGAGRLGDVAQPQPWERLAVIALAVFAVVVTLTSHRPDPDDANFLNLATSAIDDPTASLYSHDGMHGEDGLPFLANYYRVNTYELLLATIAARTGLSVQATYYILAPAVLALFVVAAYWIVLRELAGRWAIFGLILVVATLVAWGESHRTYGNFAFVRLFQGKAVMLSVFIPAIVYFAARFLRCRDGWSWVLLLLAQAAAIGCSSSAIVAAPLAAATCLLGGWRPTKTETKVVVAGLGASVYGALAAFAVYLGTESIESLDGFATQGAAHREPPPFFSSLSVVLGTEGRHLVALFALIAVPVVSAYFTRYRLIVGMSLITILLLLNPLVASLPNLLVGNMHWRVFWAIPFPLWIGLLGSGLAAYCGFLARTYGANISTAILVGVMLALPGRWTISSENGTRLGFPALKVPPERGVGIVATEQIRGDSGYVLAPWEVAAWIPTIHEHPPLIAVRPWSMSILHQHFGREEAATRRFLTDFVSARTAQGGSSDLQFEKWRTLVKERNIKAIVIPASHPSRHEVDTALKEMGYGSQSVGEYLVWSVRPSPR
jgi:hypothetical protein